MGSLAQGVLSALMLIGAIGLLGLPFFIWRRPPSYYWRCPECHTPNPVEILQCRHCEHTLLRDDLHRYARADWRGRDLLALYLTTIIACFSIGILLLILLGPIPRRAMTADELLLIFEQPEVLWIVTLLMGAVLTLLSIWMLGNRFRWSLPEIGLHGHDPASNYLWGLGVGVGVFAFGQLVGLVTSFVPWLDIERTQILQLFPMQLRDPLWVLILPASLVVNPLASEIFFRGMLYRMLRMRWELVPALWVSAILFALGSGLVVPFLPLLVLGAANGLLMERTRSLMPGIVANATQGALMTLWVLIRGWTMVA